MSKSAVKYLLLGIIVLSFIVVVTFKLATRFIYQIDGEARGELIDLKCNLTYNEKTKEVLKAQGANGKRIHEIVLESIDSYQDYDSIVYLYSSEFQVYILERNYCTIYEKRN